MPLTKRLSSGVLGRPGPSNYWMSPCAPEVCQHGLGWIHKPKWAVNFMSVELQGIVLAERLVLGAKVPVPRALLPLQGLGGPSSRARLRF